MSTLSALILSSFRLIVWGYLSSDTRSDMGLGAITDRSGEMPMVVFLGDSSNSSFLGLSPAIKLLMRDANMDMSRRDIFVLDSFLASDGLRRSERVLFFDLDGEYFLGLRFYRKLSSLVYCRNLSLSSACSTWHAPSSVSDGISPISSILYWTA